MSSIRYNWPQEIIKILKKFGFGSIFQKNSKFLLYLVQILIFFWLTWKIKYFLILKIKQPNWYFNRQYYTKPEFELAYKDYLFKFVNFLNPSLIRTDKRIDAIFEIEKKFSSVFIILEFFSLVLIHFYFYFKFQTDENLKRNLTYKNFTIKQLTIKIPNVIIFFILLVRK